MKIETRMFIALCVLEQVKFQPARVGLPPLTIQDICSMSTRDLGTYLDRIDSVGTKVSREDRANGKTEPMLSGTNIPMSTVNEHMDEIFRSRLLLDKQAERQKQLAKLDLELARLETPAERRAKLTAERDALLGLTATAEEPKEPAATT